VELFDLRKAADVNSRNSLSNRFRNRRFKRFENLVSRLNRGVNIIDIGGTKDYWVQRGWHERNDIKITVVNIGVENYDFGNISIRNGNALDLSEFSDNSFDVAYSNSVIEHLATADNQRKMAKELQRVARCFWVQTPNFWFPVEPHFHVIGWQWLPRDYRVKMLMRRRCGMRGPVADQVQAEELVDEIRLMKPSEFRSFFPGATIWRERFLGLTKSVVAFGGFPEEGR